MRKKKKTPQNRPIETLEAKAADLLAKSHYKEAIEAWRRLLEIEPNSEVRGFIQSAKDKMK